jgi:enoyl-CoA hydratase
MSMVEYETQGRVALITLNRIEARNAINRQVAREMEAAIDRMEDDPEVWVGVLRAATQGDRPTFCSGQDLKLIGSPEGNSTTAKGGFAGLAKRERNKPLIAAVDGLATAGGCEIVLSCDLVVATTRSSFGLAEVKRNLVAGAGGLFRLPRAIGRAAAMQAILTGEPLSGERAYQLGLVNELVAPGEAETAALALASKICENAPLAVWASRKVVLAVDSDDEERLWKLTDDAFRGIMHSEDLKEGLAAFAEKRAPQWKGK